MQPESAILSLRSRILLSVPNKEEIVETNNIKFTLSHLASISNRLRGNELILDTLLWKELIEKDFGMGYFSFETIKKPVPIIEPKKKVEVEETEPKLEPVKEKEQKLESSTEDKSVAIKISPTIFVLPEMVLFSRYPKENTSGTVCFVIRKNISSSSENFPTEKELENLDPSTKDVDYIRKIFNRERALLIDKEYVSKIMAFCFPKDDETSVVELAALLIPTKILNIDTGEKYVEYLLSKTQSSTASKRKVLFVQASYPEGIITGMAIVILNTEQSLYVAHAGQTLEAKREQRSHFAYIEALYITNSNRKLYLECMLESIRSILVIEDYKRFYISVFEDYSDEFQMNLGFKKGKSGKKRKNENRVRLYIDLDTSIRWIEDVESLVEENAAIKKRKRKQKTDIPFDPL